MMRGYKAQELSNGLVFKLAFEGRDKILEPKQETKEKQILAFKIPFNSREEQMNTKQVLRQVYESALEEAAFREKVNQTRWNVAFQKNSNFGDLVTPSSLLKGNVLAINEFWVLHLVELKLAWG